MRDPVALLQEVNSQDSVFWFVGQQPRPQKVEKNGMTAEAGTRSVRVSRIPVYFPVFMIGTQMSGVRPAEVHS